jgi:hypothetical protein
VADLPLGDLEARTSNPQDAAQSKRPKEKAAAADAAERIQALVAGAAEVLAAADRAYVGHRSTWVRSAPGKKGEATTGTVYAVCR